jgi:putative inorganic carbon (hco3(-)) transporter
MKPVLRARFPAVVLISLVVTAVFLLAVAHERGLKMLLALMLAAAVVSVFYLIWPVHPAYTLSAAIMLSPFAGNWAELGFPSRVDPDRLLLVFGILQVVFRAPAVRDRPRLRLTGTHAVLALAVAYALASAFFAGTLFSKADFFEIVDAFGILPFLVFLTAPVTFASQHHRRILLVALVSLGAYLGLTTLFEMIHLNALVFPRYILNPNYGIHYGRGRGPFVDAVANGFACFICAAACGVAVATWTGVRPRILAGLIGILCLVGTFLSLERSVWIGAVAAIGVTVMTTRQLRRFAVPLATTIVIAVVAALALIPGFNSTVDKRINDSASTYNRQNLVVAGLNMIRARPLTGFGWGEFENHSLLYFRQSQNYPLTDEYRYGIHNFVLTYAVELGLPGATLWALGLLLGVGSALLTRGPPDLQYWRAALVAAAVIFVVVANAIPPIAFPNLSLWLLAGVAYGGRYARSSSSAGAVASVGRRPPPVGSMAGVPPPPATPRSHRVVIDG